MEILPLFFIKYTSSTPFKKTVSANATCNWSQVSKYHGSYPGCTIYVRSVGTTTTNAPAPFKKSVFAILTIN